MNKNKLNYSLNDTTKLKEMILKRPDLPLLVFVGEEAYTGEYGYSQANANRVEIEKLALFGEVWLDKEDYREKLFDQLCEDDGYRHMTDEAFDDMVDNLVKETEFTEAIVIWVE